MRNFGERQKESYNKEAENYDKKRYESIEGLFFNQLENELLCEIIKPKKSMKILDVPSGTGRIAIPLLQTGALIFAADISENMLKEAKKKITDFEENISFQLVDGSSLPFKDNTFDVVVSFKFFHLVPNDEKRLFIDEMLRVVVPGGKVIIEFNSPFYGIFLSFYRYFIRTNKRWRIRTKCLFPDQVKYFFKDLDVASVSGVKLPLSGNISRIFGKKIVAKVNKLASHIPIIKYLNYALFVEVIKGNIE